MKFTVSKHALYSLILIGIMLTFVFVAQVRAQTDGQNGIDYSAVNKVEREKISPEQRRAEMEEMKNERKMTLMRHVQERIINLASNVTRRLNASVTRMENIIGRLDARIEKLNQSGVDTRGAITKLGDAKNTISVAKSTLEGLGSIHSAVTGDTPREAYASIRTQFMAVRDLLKQTHVLLRETVALLKEAVRNAEADHGVSGAVTNEKKVGDTE